MTTLAMPRILAFDIFGTVVDWHGSIAREVNAMELGVSGDEFALAWRAGYQPAMQKVRSGELGWTRIDELHRMILDELLLRFRITRLDEARKQHLNRVWHRLDPWPDSVEGIACNTGAASCTGSNMPLSILLLNRSTSSIRSFAPQSIPTLQPAML